MTTTTSDLPESLAEAIADADHDLKTWPTYFSPVWEGYKLFEVRLDDRGYQAGDFLALSEWDPHASCDCREHGKDHPRTSCTRYTGRVITTEIGYVMSTTPRLGGRPGFVGNGWVVLSLVDIAKHDVPAPAPRGWQVVVDSKGTHPVEVGRQLSSAIADYERAVGRRARFSENLKASARPLLDHNTAAANCRYSEGECATNITCSPCQRAQATP